MACDVLPSDTCWGGVVGLSAIEFKAHITAGTFDVGVTSKAPTQGEPFIREARTHPFNGTQEQKGVYTMTQEDSVRRLAEIRERADKATPGPWTTNEFNDVLAGEIAVAESVPFEGGGVYQEDDAEFIAHSREDVPYLLSVIDSLTAERDEARFALGMADLDIRGWFDRAEEQAARAEAAEADRERLREALGLAKAHIMSLAPGEPSYIDAALATPPSEGQS